MFTYEGLGMSAGSYGAVLSIAAPGAIAGAVFAPKITRRFGVGRAMTTAAFAEPVFILGVAATPALPASVVLAASGMCAGFFQTLYVINSVSVRQARVGAAEQTATHATYRTLIYGVVPLGAFAGGSAVSLLTPELGPLGAAKSVVLGSAVVAMIAALPLLGIQGLLGFEQRQS